MTLTLSDLNSNPINPVACRQELTAKLSRSVSRVQVDRYVSAYCGRPEAPPATPEEMALHHEAPCAGRGGH